jgi:hypothetical protein
MEIACVLCSTGVAVALLALWALIAGPGDHPKIAAALLVLGFVGAASCAAEDRVCELAGMTTTAP